MKKAKYIKLCTTIMVVILFSSCVQSISQQMLSQAHDDVPPEFTNVTPENGFAYGAYTQISGTVTDLDSDGEAGRVDSVTLEVVGISEALVLDVDEDGRFVTEMLKTYGDAYVGPINIKITALDWKGNSKEYNLNYSKSDGEITSFSLERGNKELTLHWSGIPGGGGTVYEIRELFYGLGTQNIESRESEVSLIWDGLENGKNYSFIISAVSAEESEKVFSSSIKSMMPLSPLSCTPVVTVNENNIDLLWPQLTDVDKYVVQRSSSLGGSWETIGITANNFLRYNESSETIYYFRVYPYSPDAPLEEELLNKLAASNMKTYHWNTEPNPSSVGTYADNSGFTGIKEQGDFAYLTKDDGSVVILNISNPASPTLVRSFTDVESGTPVHLTVHGDYGFLSCETSDLIILDLSDPGNPLKLGQLKFTAMYPKKSYLYGSYLYLILEADSSPGNTALAIVDVSDPAYPELIAKNSTFSSYLYDIIFFRQYNLNENLAIVSYSDTESRIKVYDLISPNIFNNSTISTDQVNIYENSSSISVKSFSYTNSKLFCLSNTNALTGDADNIGAFDFSLAIPFHTQGGGDDPIGAMTASKDWAYVPNNIIALGDYAIYNSRHGLSIFNYGVRTTLTVNAGVNSFDPSDTPGNNDITTDIAIQGNYAYLTTSKGLEVFSLIP
ncbi:MULTISPECIES: hypothetical protein [unclassified Oceanispirochaeta]|uniref:hypothetical protein n=1 Tax=unclassified Oceanispirochaeta TaxID=2635722 RepID=UPI000E092326|nr:MULTISPECIES: hypothetical protein [unclassified Oceanispirochaeta]MBF9014940.1 hypothetical protein [Oceanispirochaeta sp. M2]NPD71379.1 hypothetical protein [Oceanispirochaeta sp. M1]RDG33344.1 hypothetical protein DV872_04620 [Oceanispirochaeta sp. M1]